MHEQQPVDDRTDPAGEISNAVRNQALRQRIEHSPRVGDGPHVWIGTIDDYLAAAPWGQWMAAARPVAALVDDIDELVRRAPSRIDDALPTWHVFSHSGFGRHQPAATASVRELVRCAEQAREDTREYTAWASLGSNDRAWLLRFKQAYQGRFDRLQDWLALQVEAVGYDRILDLVVPETIRPHVEINLDSLAHELRATGAVTTVKDPEQPGQFIFRLQ